MLSGNVDIIIENTEFNISKPCIVLIPPLKYHSVYTSKSSKYERIIVTFPQSAIPVEISKQVRDLNNRSLILRDSETVELSNKLKKNIIACDTDIYGPLIISYMTEVFYKFYENKDVIAEVIENGSENKLISAIIEYVNSHINEKIALDDIASAVFSSKSTICHVFKGKFQTSIKQYILQKKIALAEEMISKGCSAMTASQAVGYTNYANFFSVYKKTTGKKPSDVLPLNSQTPR